MSALANSSAVGASCSCSVRLDVVVRLAEPAVGEVQPRIACRAQDVVIPVLACEVGVFAEYGFRGEGGAALANANLDRLFTSRL